MFNNSTNSNKTNNYLSPQLTEHMTYDVGNPRSGLVQAQFKYQNNPNIVYFN